MRRFFTVALLVLSLPSLLTAGVPFSFWKSNFDPQPPPTPLAWWDSSVLSLSNGATVSQYTDRQTGAYNGTLGGSGSNITYAWYGQNGRSVISWPGGVEKHYGISGLGSTPPYTVAAIINVPNAAVNTGYTLLGAQLPGGLTIACYISTSGNATAQLVKTFTVGIANSTSTFTTGTYHQVIWQISATNYAFYIDGVAAGSGANGQTVSASALDMGTENNTFNTFAGFMGEVIIYNSFLGPTDLTALHVMAQRKWGTP